MATSVLPSRPVAATLWRMERYRLTCLECGRFLTDVRIERDLLGRDVILSLNGFCAHVSPAQLERELDEVLAHRSGLPVSIEAIGEAARR